ncbi:MAG: L-threonylcarbamoyladenylate synthase [Candidatus Geothermarchaeales archaeon]
MRIGHETIRLASRIIAGGGLVVFPTDTVYGLGCDPSDDQAVGRVFLAKRKARTPLPVLGSGMKSLRSLCHFNERSLRVAKAFWPGRVTIVLPARKYIPAAAGRDTLGVRVPRDSVALDLIERCGGLLAGTSANVTGRKAPAEVDGAFRQLGEAVDLYLDGGETLGTPSTVVDLAGDEPHLLRRGAIPFDEILKELGN